MFAGNQVNVLLCVTLITTASLVAESVANDGAGTDAKPAVRPSNSASAEDLLRAHLKGHDAVKHSSMWVKASLDYRPFDKTQAPKIIAEFSFLRDGERMKAEMGYSYPDSPERKPQQHRYAFDGSKWSQTLYYDNGKKSVTISKNKASRDQFLYHTLYGGALEGYFIGSGNQPIAEHMLAAKQCDLGQPEKIGGHDCEVVSANTPYGRAKIWIAPSLGYTAQKIELRKGLDDLYFGKPLSQSPFSPSTYDGQRLIGWSAVVSGVTVKQIGGKFVSVGGRLIETAVLSDHRDLVGSYHYERSEVDLEPKCSDEDFQVDVPD
jgi:hypothetical protein